MRSWLFKGIHPFKAAPRQSHVRRNAGRVLGEDHRADAETNGGWRELASALQRHTLHDALIHLAPDERHIVTLAYLQGRTNRQIAAMLGISVSTVGRRLSQALDHLDDYVRRTRSWISAILLLGLGTLAARARIAGSAAAADWTHRAAATVAVGTVAVVSVGLVATSPDSAPVRHASASTGINVVVTPWDGVRGPLARIGALSPAPATTTVVTVSTGPSEARVETPETTPPENEATAPVVRTSESGSGAASNEGCHGRPADVEPVGGDHPEGPAAHLATGGCQK